MNNDTTAGSDNLLPLAENMTRFGQYTVRLGLALVIAWIGAMKFTAYEAHGISGFVQNSPLLSWVYNLMSIQQFSNALGTLELAIATGLIFGLVSARVAIISALAASGMFATTLSFMITTPGTFEQTIGFPALSVVPGQFLIKDVVSLAVSILLLGDGLKLYATRRRQEQMKPTTLTASQIPVIVKI